MSLRAGGLMYPALSRRRRDVVRSMYCGCWIAACREVRLDARPLLPSLELRESCCRNFNGAWSINNHDPTLINRLLRFSCLSTEPFAQVTRAQVQSISDPRYRFINIYSQPHSSRLHHVQEQL
jgi:hypothetical protein